MGKVVPPDKMPEVYSAYEYFVHLPIVKWSCERLSSGGPVRLQIVTNSNEGSRGAGF
ncbi:hypothetical protein DFAR_3900005 [Desulfarculales bacterium]